MESATASSLNCQICSCWSSPWTHSLWIQKWQVHLLEAWGTTWIYWSTEMIIKYIWHWSWCYWSYCKTRLRSSTLHSKIGEGGGLMFNFLNLMFHMKHYKVCCKAVFLSTLKTLVLSGYLGHPSTHRPWATAFQFWEWIKAKWGERTQGACWQKKTSKSYWRFNS